MLTTILLQYEQLGLVCETDILRLGFVDPILVGADWPAESVTDRTKDAREVDERRNVWRHKARVGPQWQVESLPKVSLHLRILTCV